MRAVTVCMDPGANLTAFYLGQATANQVLRQAGVKIEWRHQERACVASGIVITVSERTPHDRYPGALAYALPIERTRIVVFYDRVVMLNSANGPARVPSVLGHVLAHEIIHLLQGVARHSDSGVMKQKWEQSDYAAMRFRPLRLTEDDIFLIQRGLER